MHRKIIFGIALVCVIIAIGVMFSPHAYVMRWMSPPDTNEIWTDSYSYFSLTPYGYANFFPLITAVTAITCAMFLACCPLFKKLAKATFTITSVSLATSLFSMLMTYIITVEVIIITVMLAASFVLQLLNMRQKTVLVN